MRRLLIAAAILMLLGFTLVFAAEKPRSSPPLPPKIPEMNTAGTVIELSAALLKIERTLKGKTEVMEFVLEMPLANVKAGDSIKIGYIEKNGRNVLIRVAPAKKTEVKKAGKKELPKEMKPLTPAVAPATK